MTKKQRISLKKWLIVFSCIGLFVHWWIGNVCIGLCSKNSRYDFFILSVNYLIGTYARDYDYYLKNNKKNIIKAFELVRIIYDKPDDILIEYLNYFEFFSKYCSRWSGDLTDGGCLKMVIRNRLIEHTKIFEKIMQIISNPCKYIPTTEDIKIKFKKHNLNFIKENGFLESEILHLFNNFEETREQFQCDKKSWFLKRPKMIILEVVDSKGKYLFDIVVQMNYED